MFGVCVRSDKFVVYVLALLGPGGPGERPFARAASRHSLRVYRSSFSV